MAYTTLDLIGKAADSVIILIVTIMLSVREGCMKEKDGNPFLRELQAVILKPSLLGPEFRNKIFFSVALPSLHLLL